MSLLPRSIPESLMASYRPHMADKERKIMENVYKLDLNALPGEFILQADGKSKGGSETEVGSEGGSSEKQKEAV